ncbi:MAG TPA: hypothetical protein VGR16_13240 [Thermomicrobiales bacterium]|nr:hypothetical protein [Thermomicrobiales bacterium]
MPLEHRLERGDVAVAASDIPEESTFRAHHRGGTVLVGKESGQLFGGHIVRNDLCDTRGTIRCEFPGQCFGLQFQLVQIVRIFGTVAVEFAKSTVKVKRLVRRGHYRTA